MIRYLAFAVLLVPVLPAWGADKPPADPAATKLLADARAARAQWEHFAGFRARLEINIDGTVARGTVEVSPKGKVTIQVPDAAPEAAKWAHEQLASLAAHRLADALSPDTPCAFVDNNKDHPLGRAIRVLDDEYHSSYRVRDNQIIVVNRQMQEGRFTITVTENHINREGKYLPVCYVVNSWEGKSDALKSSATYHHTWKRVGAFDLPVTVTVVTATPGVAAERVGKQMARSLKLSEHELLK